MLGLALAAVAGAAACGLDLVGSGVSSHAVGATDAAVRDGSSGGPQPGSSGGVQPGPGDGGTFDAAGAGSSSGGSSSGGPDAATACDQDKDGFASKACGGDDCCDDDARVHPGANDWQSGPGGCGGFDFNCDGREEQRYGVKNCHMGLGCEGTGFDQDTACGVSAAHTWCLGILRCNELGDTQTQQCR